MTKRGILVSFDGPGGVGKTTTIRYVADLLTSAGLPLHRTVEPSTGPIGQLARSLTETVSGEALACLFAADRHHHLHHVIRPHLATGKIVLCDRYLPSGLAVQRMDGLSLDYLAGINEAVDPPDLAVILTAPAAIIGLRLTQRGPHNRYQRGPGGAELAHYAEAATHLTAAGVHVLQLDTADHTPPALAALIARTISELLSETSPTIGAPQ